MKRDMDLIREILGIVEESIDGVLATAPAIEGRSKAEIAEHIRLATDGGLLDARLSRPLKGHLLAFNITLTWRGHEFLDQTRDPDIWDKTKTAAGKVGSFSVPLMMEMAAGYIKAKAASVGIPMI